MGGFLSRFRHPRGDDSAVTPIFKGEVVSLEPIYDASDSEPAPDKIAAPDLNAEGNDVATETLEIAHEGFMPSGDQAPSPTYTMFNADGTPIRSTADEGASTLLDLDQEHADSAGKDMVLKGKPSLLNAVDADEDSEPDLDDLN